MIQHYSRRTLLATAGEIGPALALPILAFAQGFPDRRCSGALGCYAEHALNETR
jgi:hypothetical protein